MKRIFLSMAVLAVACISMQAVTLDEVVKNHTEARGGLGKIKAINSIIVGGTMSMQGMDIAYTSYAKRELKFRMELTVQGMKIVSGFDGETAWSLNPMRGGGVEKSPSEEKQRMKSQADMIDGDLIDFDKKGLKLELVGPEDVDGATAYKIKVIESEQDTRFIYIDAITWLMVKEDRTMNMMGQEVDVEMLFSNYKEIAGVQMVGQVDIRSQGEEVMSMTWDTITPNSDVPDALFAMPKE